MATVGMRSPPAECWALSIGKMMMCALTILVSWDEKDWKITDLEHCYLICRPQTGGRFMSHHLPVCSMSPRFSSFSESPKPCCRTWTNIKPCKRLREAEKEAGQSMYGMPHIVLPLYIKNLNIFLFLSKTWVQVKGLSCNFGSWVLHDMVTEIFLGGCLCLKDIIAFQHFCGRSGDVVTSFNSSLWG